MNKRNPFKSRFLRAALMLTLAVMTFPIKAWAQVTENTAVTVTIGENTTYYNVGSSEYGNALNALLAAVTAANNSTSDVTVKLYTDVDLGEAYINFYNTNTVGEGQSARPVAITLDLNAKTLSGTYTNVFYDDNVVCVKENTSLTITNNGNSGGITAEDGFCIENSGTLTLNDSPTLTSNSFCILNVGTLTLNGSPTIIGGNGCITNFGMLTLNGQTTFSCRNDCADILLNEGMKIGIGTDFAISNNSKIKVCITSSNNFPYTFTSGYGANVKSGGDIIAPDDIFVCIKDDGHIATPTFQLVGEGDAAEAKACLQDPIQVAYIDANGKLHDNADGQEGTDDDMAPAYKLTGTENMLGKYGTETWYVTDFGTASSMTYNHYIYIDGTVHIILANGKHMKIGNSIADPINDNGIRTTWNFYTAQSTIYFYGQSTDYSDNANACGKLSIYSTSSSINSGYNLTINGGIIEAYSTNGNGIDASRITINGGQVTANGGTNGNGISAGGDIILGWKTPDDFIQASSYSVRNNSKVKKIADGKIFQYTEGEGSEATVTKLYEGTITASIDGKKLTPYGYGGYCGKDDETTTDTDESKNLTWEIPLGSDGQPVTTLTISGTGEMADYDNADSQPWKNYRNDIKSIVIESGVTAIDAINGFTNLESITINSNITAKSILAPGVTVNAKVKVNDNDVIYSITANGDVTAGSVIATSLTATNYNLTLTGTGSEIGTTYLGTGTLTVYANAGGSVGQLTAGTVNVNKGGKLTATSVDNLQDLTVTGDTLSISEASDLSGAVIKLAEGGVIKSDGGSLTVGGVSGAGTIQGKAGVVLMSNINNPNLNIVAETKDIDATAAGVTTINAKSLTAKDGNIVANGKDITAGTISVSGVTAQDITAGTISTKGTVTARNIKAGSGGVTISGGQVTVEGISASNGNIILGWKASEDFIQANSYSGTVKIADGQYFTYEGNTGSPLSGTLSAEQVTAIAGKKLTPTSKPYGTITVSAKGWSGEYDGKGHSITVTVKKPSGATVKYRAGTSGSYSKTNPSFTDVGTYTVYYKVTKANYTTVAGNKKVTITPADVKYDGGTITQDEKGYHVSFNETPETKDGSEGSSSADPLPISGHVDELDYSRKLGAPTADDGGEGQGEVKGDVTIGGKEANLFTVCLPFALPTGKDKSDDVTYYTLSSVTGTTLDFTAVEDKDIAAFTPYLIAVTGDSDFTLSCTDESFDTDEKILTTTVQTEAGDFTFTGTLTGLSNADAVKVAGEGNVTYILQKGSQWGKVKDDTEEHRKAYIPPFRAFVTGPDVVVAEARTLVSSFGETVGIDHIRTTDRDGTERWYDLNGRRIEKPHRKGLYIRNGKVTTTN